MTTKELYTQGARVWVEHPDTVWESATVTSDYRSKVIIVKLERTQEIRQIQIKDESKMPPLCNPDLLIGQNDLTSLSYLHEPAVLHNLRVRFCDRNAIYTYCGIVLVAINPYYDLPIYGDETIMAYRGQAMGDLDPHIFAVSEEAYTKLEREKRDQSIIVSGESGAGKTVSAKYAMRYFAAVGGSVSETHVEKKVLASSPIMEAIGNAKTTRNDNSSRFGKFIEIRFDDKYKISGASMRTYLLEKSRVVYQSPGERNYHIFYQLCAASGVLKDLYLDHQDTFHYLNQGGSPDIDGVDDLRAFNDTRHALTTLGVTESEQIQMFTILSAVLHLGNIEMREAEEDGQEDAVYIDPNDNHLTIVCSLLGLNRPTLARWLSHRKIASGTEVIESRLSRERAVASRDALAKRIYADLYGWIVQAVNRALNTHHDAKHFIGVLDIYGFETFEINSFEQFCINYANEKLQQQFNSHVFKLEQDEYIKEGISWTMIDFYDNQPCIDLIEDKLGILALLDEECRVPQGSDQGFVSKLHTKCAQYPHFVKPRFGSTAFIIKHFADDVEYQAGGFLEKNRDTVSEDQLECIKSATACRLIHDIFGSGTDSQSATLPPPKRRAPSMQVHSLTQPAKRTSTHKATVGGQFRSSLALLALTLSSTTPHYVRCVKPNDFKAPFTFDAARAVQQLRACGVLETIRISAAGFPSRWLYQDFFQRYRLLCTHKDIDRGNVKATCNKILNKHINDKDKYQFGATKIFFRAGQVAYLEKIRGDLQRAYCVKVQSCVRRFIARKRYLRVISTIRGLQARGRGVLARRKAAHIRRERAAITIQRHARGRLCRNKYAKVRQSLVRFTAVCKGYLLRMMLKNKRIFMAAITIQRYTRGYLARKKVERMKRQIVVTQSAVRRMLACRQYKKLRIEARSLDHVKTLNKGLENKIFSLQQKLEDVNEKNKVIERLQKQIGELKTKLEALKPLEIEVKTLKEDVNTKTTFIISLEEQLQSERDSNRHILKEKREIEEKYEKDRLEWEGESEKLASELRSNKEHLEMEIEERDRRHESEKKALSAELEAERQSRQKLLSTQYELQERIDSLQKSAVPKEHKRSLSDASNTSQQETTVEDDYGYGSVRSVEATRPALEAVNWSAGAPPQQPPTVADAGLVLRMQNRISSLQSELSRTMKRASDLEERLSTRLQSAPSNPTSDRHRVEEFEMENNKLREQLDRLRAADGIIVSKEVIEQMSVMQKELDRRRDECIQLKSVLTNQTVNLKSLATSNYGSDVDIINEDGELATAYEAQKGINRQLQDELLAEKKFYSEHISEYKAEIARLREENEKYQRLLSTELSQEAKSKGQEFAQHEISKLAAESLALQERVDKLSESCRRYKQQIRQLVAKLAELGIQDVDAILDSNDTSTPQQIAPLAHTIAPVTRKKEREYLGMFEYKKQDEALIIKKLITDLKPRTAVSLLPCLPAYILFMMLRHMDHVDDEPKMHQLMKSVRSGVRKTLKRQQDSVEHRSLWLANMLRLLNNLRQYSGDAVYQTANSPRQNQQCLRVFDLSEYRQVLSDTAVWIYQSLIELLERQLERLIIPAILEHEEISGLTVGKVGPPTTPTAGPNRLKNELDAIHHQLKTYAVENSLILSIFKQLFYYICAFSLNQLLLRKDLCCWAKGLQIRYNISHLETWIKESLLEYGQNNVEAVLSVLRPITQAVQLLQARKSMADVTSTVDMCPDLTAPQVCKILYMYTPAEEYEVKVTRDFIHEIQKKMQERVTPHDNERQNLMLMDVKMIFSVQFAFNPSPIRLEDIEIPEVLGLQDVLTKI